MPMRDVIARRVELVAKRRHGADRDQPEVERELGVVPGDDRVVDHALDQHRDRDAERRRRERAQQADADETPLHPPLPREMAGGRAEAQVRRIDRTDWCSDGHTSESVKWHCCACHLAADRREPVQPDPEREGRGDDPRGHREQAEDGELGESDLVPPRRAARAATGASRASRRTSGWVRCCRRGGRPATGRGQRESTLHSTPRAAIHGSAMRAAKRVNDEPAGMEGEQVREVGDGQQQRRRVGEMRAREDVRPRARRAAGRPSRRRPASGARPCRRGSGQPSPRAATAKTSRAAGARAARAPARSDADRLEQPLAPAALRQHVQRGEEADGRGELGDRARGPRRRSMRRAGRGRRRVCGKERREAARRGRATAAASAAARTATASNSASAVRHSRLRMRMIPVGPSGTRTQCHLSVERERRVRSLTANVQAAEVDISQHGYSRYRESACER